METILLLLGALAILPVFFSDHERRPRPVPCFLRDALPQVEQHNE